MFNTFIFSAIFISIFSFCNAEYQIIPLSPEDQKNYVKSELQTSNSSGTTIGLDGTDLWLFRPETNKKEILYHCGYDSRTPTDMLVTETGRAIAVFGGGINEYYGKRKLILVRNTYDCGSWLNPYFQSPKLSAFNNLGEVVFYDSGTLLGRTCLLTDDNTLTDIYFITGHAINDLSQIVGFGRYENLDKYALIWDKENGSRNLNSLIPQDSGWNLTDAYYINNEGIIRGRGDYQGQSCEFLLIPD